MIDGFQVLHVGVRSDREAHAGCLHLAELVHHGLVGMPQVFRQPFGTLLFRVGRVFPVQFPEMETQGRDDIDAFFHHGVDHIGAAVGIHVFGAVYAGLDRNAARLLVEVMGAADVGSNPQVVDVGLIDYCGHFLRCQERGDLYQVGFQLDGFPYPLPQFPGAVRFHRPEGGMQRLKLRSMAAGDGDDGA